MMKNRFIFGLLAMSMFTPVYASRDRSKRTAKCEYDADGFDAKENGGRKYEQKCKKDRKRKARENIDGAEYVQCKVRPVVVDSDIASFLNEFGFTDFSESED